MLPPPQPVGAGILCSLLGALHGLRITLRGTNLDVCGLAFHGRHMYQVKFTATFTKCAPRSRAWVGEAGWGQGKAAPPVPAT